MLVQIIFWSSLTAVATSLMLAYHNAWMRQQLRRNDVANARYRLSVQRLGESVGTNIICGVYDSCPRSLDLARDLVAACQEDQRESVQKLSSLLSESSRQMIDRRAAALEEKK